MPDWYLVGVSPRYADWCFERTARLPSEWLAVDTATTEAKARDFLRGRFEACYPFHPSTLSVFQRKWRALTQFQQTRGTLAMLAQWISWAAREHFQQARREPLITLGSAPLPPAPRRWPFAQLHAVSGMAPGKGVQSRMTGAGAVGGGDATA